MITWLSNLLEKINIYRNIIANIEIIYLNNFYLWNKDIYAEIHWENFIAKDNKVIKDLFFKKIILIQTGFFTG